MPKGYLGRTMATCHPERVMAAKGLCNACYLKKFYEERPKRNRKNEYTQRDYGISEKEYYERRELQRKAGDLCGLCKDVLGDDAHFDHNHSNGQLREFLHKKCNLALGLLGDDPEKCRKAAEYLEKHQEIKNVSEQNRPV